MTRARFIDSVFAARIVALKVLRCLHVALSRAGLSVVRHRSRCHGPPGETAAYHNGPSGEEPVQGTSCGGGLRMKDARFQIVAAVADLIHDMEECQPAFDAALCAEQRDYYLPHEDAQMRWMFCKFPSQWA